MKTNNEQLIKKMYGSSDLAEKPAFQGGYINFGYWKDIISKGQQITIEERIKASNELYNLIIKQMNIQDDDEILEIGCGRGYGCIKIIEKFNVKRIVGIDITNEQIIRAKHLQSNYLQLSNKLTFQICNAVSTPFPNNSFDKIYAVESVQHISSISKLAQESFRLLKQDGLLIITAHFSTSPEGYIINQQHFPLMNEGIDLLLPIDEVKDNFIEQGLKIVNLIKIGKDVFLGMDQWSKQIRDQEWAPNFLKMYNEGNLDYYILIFKKCNLHEYNEKIYKGIYKKNPRSRA